MTRKELDKLRELASKATPGPWVWFRSFRFYFENADADWIAAADPTTITALLDHIDRLEREARAGRELHQKITVEWYSDGSMETFFDVVDSAINAYDTATKETGQ